MKDGIRILNPKAGGVRRLPAERIPIGKPRDYKPCVARLASGELIVVAFRWQQFSEQQKISEKMILFRSGDGGMTWKEVENLDIPGREFYLTVLPGGVILVTAHFLTQDIRNGAGYTLNLLLRSEDGGRSWVRTEIRKEHVPGADEKSPSINTTRNILELPDGTLVYGVSAAYGYDYLWRSTDGGKSWDRSQRCRFDGIDASKLWSPLWAEAVLRRARCGDLLTLLRVDPKIFPPIPGTTVPREEADHYERIVIYRSRDGGKIWAPEPESGFHYGEMYPSILRLEDGRMLLTFTVRAAVPPRVPPLGVHAVLGRETDDAFAFDFERDRFVLDEKTPVGQYSGGGFGPTVQLEDGTLVTSYSYSGPGEWPNDVHLEIVRWQLP